MNRDTRNQDSRVVLEAIALRKCLSALYNRGRIILAPHILYTRHDELYVDGVVIERDGRSPRELKIGTFKLDGLGELEVTERGFDPFPYFDADQEKYATRLFAV